MSERNSPACPLHGDLPRAQNPHNFFGIVSVIDSLIDTISGVGTTSYTRCPYGYPANFEGVVRALEDLNATTSGIQGGGGGAADIAAGSGIYFTTSGTTTIINATVVSASGLSIAAGSGIYLTQGGSVINIDYPDVYEEVISGQFLDDGSVTVLYSGLTVTVSGTDLQGTGGRAVVGPNPTAGFIQGTMWFDTNQGRMMVYASGVDVDEPGWYQTNAEAIASKGEAPPSGYGLNSPPRDGSIWFNTLMGSLFVYDTASSGWYETGPQRSFAYGPAAPAPTTAGAGWYDSDDNALKVWDGTNWINA
jgi:hypothetical protein